jgi:PTS system galactitol-specific IIC component
MPEGAVEIISISDGFLWPAWLFTNLVDWLGGAIGLLIIAALLVVVFFFYLKNRKAWEQIAGAPVEE